jgi:hypothetical protein
MAAGVELATKTRGALVVLRSIVTVEWATSTDACGERIRPPTAPTATATEPTTMMRSMMRLLLEYRCSA